jgi:virulence-associated protein VagC
MKLVATEQGLCIPKEYLGEAQEFEVVQEQDKIIITGIKKSVSIWDLGEEPVDCDLEDGAVNHDRYLYDK